MSTPTVLVAAAPTLHRGGLVALLREQWPHLQLTLTADATQVPQLVCRQPYYGLLIADALLPGLCPTLLLTQLHQARPTQRLALLTGPGQAAPTGPLPWPDTRLLLSRQALPAAFASALAPWLQEVERPAADLPKCGAGGRAGGFSPRELQVLSLVVADHCNDEIAAKLCLSVRTVESHRRMLLQKSGTRTLVGLAARAVREGWVA